MKLHELELNEFRGIRSILLPIAGDNLVIWGENGTGKSAIVDAIDFLLTGSISRLTGEGTGNIELADYGPHIDSDPDNSWVRGMFVFPGDSTPIEIIRRMNNPKNFETNSTKKKVIPYLNFAKQGQHMLTRGEILNYISCTPGDRSKRLEALLKMNDITRIRSHFVTISNEYRSAFTTKNGNYERFKGDITSLVSIKKYDELKIIEFINSHRTKIDGSPISELTSITIQSDLNPPITIPKPEAVKPEIIESGVDALISLVTEDKIKTLFKSYKILLNEIAEISDIVKFQSTTTQLNFYTLGLSLVESNRCPFCDLSYDSMELTSHIKQKIDSVETYKKKLELIQEKSKVIISELYTLRGGLSNLLPHVLGLNLVEEHDSMTEWVEHIDRLIKVLESDIMEIVRNQFTKTTFHQLIIHQKSIDSFETILSESSKLSPTISPQLVSWDILTTLKVHLTNLENSKKELDRSEILMKRAQALLTSFEKCKDNEINHLYNQIKDRFSELYRTLHGEDEQAFSAQLQSDHAALDLRVAFYGRDHHPPIALHSEGHQDSMGLCLWLALSEHITGNRIQFKIMDDVVMSVDSGHRRSIADMIVSMYDESQFIITTHDQTWVNQLKTAGGVKSKNCYHFSNWSIEEGPRYKDEDTWSLIEKDLDFDMIPRAASTLRRDSEFFFTEVCRTIRAPVRLTYMNQWSLGDLLPPAVGEYKRLLKKALFAANSWNKKNIVAELSGISNSLGDSYALTNAEQWGVNASLHYNEWANLTKEDFIPVAEAFKQLFKVFHCPECHGLIKAMYSGTNPVSLSCNCGSVNYTLIEKKKDR